MVWFMNVIRKLDKMSSFQMVNPKWHPNPFEKQTFLSGFHMFPVFESPVFGYSLYSSSQKSIHNNQLFSNNYNNACELVHLQAVCTVQ